MPRGPSIFKQADLTRAIKGATAGGMDVNRIEIDRYGKIVLVKDEAAPTDNALDAWRRRNGEG